MTAPSSTPPAGGADAGADPSPRMLLSALADGDQDSLPRAAALWRDDAAARECWHLYHLIGDVMRSDDLASRPGRDVAFVARLRARLASEPVPLAPAPVVPPSARRLGWRAPAAVAAGFVAVAVAVVWMRPQGLGGEQLAVAGGAGPVSGETMRVVSSRSAGIDSSTIRDARLDAYLRAHQWARGATAGMPGGGGLRSVEMLVTPEPLAAALAAPRSASNAR